MCGCRRLRCRTHVQQLFGGKACSTARGELAHHLGRRGDFAYGFLFFTRRPISNAVAICGDISPLISMRIRCSISSWKISRCSMQRVSASAALSSWSFPPRRNGLLSDIQGNWHQGMAVLAQHGFGVGTVPPYMGSVL